MTSADILDDLTKKPFEPLRFYVADGSVYDVRHPKQCMVGYTSVVVGVPGTNGGLPYERLIRIGCEHVVRIEPIRPLPTAGTAQPPD